MMCPNLVARISRNPVASQAARRLAESTNRSSKPSACRIHQRLLPQSIFRSNQCTDSGRPFCRRRHHDAGQHQPPAHQTVCRAKTPMHLAAKTRHRQHCRWHATPLSHRTRSIWRPAPNHEAKHLYLEPMYNPKDDAPMGVTMQEPRHHLIRKARIWGFPQGTQGSLIATQRIQQGNDARGRRR